MTDELKPCPFCGAMPSIGLFGDSVIHDCKASGAFISSIVEGWNTRYQRTCRIESTTEGWDVYEEYIEHKVWKLSCGHEVITLDDPPRFCEICGAEVVDDDHVLR